MDSDLLCAMESLNFTEEEAAVVSEISDESNDSSLWLVGSIISCKQFDGDSIIRILRSVWKTKNILEMVELQPNFFLIKPSSPGAKDMILKRRPWTAHNDFFSIKPYVPAFATTEYVFHFMTIWVRVYKLPLRAMNRDMGLRLGGSFRTALGVDHRVEGGNMGHVLSSCKAKPAADDGKKLQYGSWLRVSTQHPRPRKRTRIEYFTAPDSEPIVSPSSSCFPDGFTADIAATEKGVPTAANATEGEVPAAAY
ncbi:hypothetical protein V6N11_035756 [Hibiscus sabdariffa]|uniref:DUF4283 domain-containing protein n=1 Tax=Hibiscus sabdariffa TaxID=183260 RepID=A0ABR2R8D3_9ROSI